jgi:two-component system chemotaxis response regulator CheB
MKALALGALDCIPKPEATERMASAEFRRELIDKIRHLGSRRIRGRVVARGPMPGPGAPSADRTGPRARAR